MIGAVVTANTMSRRGRGSSASKKVASGPPPSHPAETFKEHRKFLIRSLDRNDTDMNALIDLNKSLRGAKENVVRSCGELVLLDLGSGRLKLINDQLHDEAAVARSESSRAKPEATPTGTATTGSQQKKQGRHLSPAQKEVCVDFLLRMKLRRKLSNRLVRRLTRLAHAMDGKDVLPPSAPKYGDLRLHINPKYMELRNVEFIAKEDAKKRIAHAIHLDLLDSEKNDGATNSPKKEEENELEETKQDAEHGVNDVLAVTKQEEKTEESNEKQGGKPKTTKIYYNSPALSNDFKLLKEYERVYEKTWDVSRKSFNYTIANENAGDSEYKQMIKGGGIGASALFNSLDDLQAEHKRWQTNLLRKIQQQPTSRELGLKNRVFQLKERRKRCLEKNAAEEEEGTPSKKVDNKENVVSNNEDDDDVDHSMDVGDNNDENAIKKRTEDDGEEIGETEGDHEIERKDLDEVEIKPKRSISFAAVPSFHDQDLGRISLIHRDLLNASQAELTRKRLNDATNDYNKCKRRNSNTNDPMSPFAFLASILTILCFQLSQFFFLFHFSQSIVDATC